MKKYIKSNKIQIWWHGRNNNTERYDMIQESLISNQPPATPRLWNTDKTRTKNYIHFTWTEEFTSSLSLTVGLTVMAYFYCCLPTLTQWCWVKISKIVFFCTIDSLFFNYPLIQFLSFLSLSLSQNLHTHTHTHTHNYCANFKI
jgi:hypothetical protein